MLQGGRTMPEFTSISVQEAQIRTIPGRQGKFINEYADYIQQLARGQAGRLRIGESENPLTIRRRLAVAAQTLGVNLIIKRSGQDIYFWKDEREAAQPRTKRRYTRQTKAHEERTVPDQPGDELGMVAQGILGRNPRK
jgi:hypothetical protein